MLLGGCGRRFGPGRRAVFGWELPPTGAGRCRAVILKSGSGYYCRNVFLESRPTDGAASGFCGWFDSVDFCRFGNLLVERRLDPVYAHCLLQLGHQSPKPFIACIEDLTHFGAGSNGFGIGGASLGEKGKMLEKGRSVAGELGGGFGIDLHARRLTRRESKSQARQFGEQAGWVPG